MILPRDWVSLVLDPQRRPELLQALEATRTQCRLSKTQGDSHRHAKGLPANDLGQRLVTHPDSWTALLLSGSNDVTVAAEATRQQLQGGQVAERNALPVELQEMIIRWCVRFDAPILEFGGLYTNPPPQIGLWPAHDEQRYRPAVAPGMRKAHAEDRSLLRVPQYANYPRVEDLTRFAAGQDDRLWPRGSSLEAANRTPGWLSRHESIPRPSNAAVPVEDYCTWRLCHQRNLTAQQLQLMPIVMLGCPVANGKHPFDYDRRMETLFLY